MGAGALWFMLPGFVQGGITPDLFEISLFVAVPSIVALLFDLPAGALSDRIGRKKTIICGLLISALAGAVLSIALSAAGFALFALLFGLSLSLVVAAARALIMDISPPHKAGEYFGIAVALMTLGSALGPLVAGSLLEPSFEEGLPTALVFYWTAILASLAVFSLVGETVKDKKPVIASVRELIAGKLFLPAVRDFKSLKSAGIIVILATFALTFVDGVIWTYEPLLYGEKGLGAAFGGTLLFVFVISLVLFQAIGGFLADRFGKSRILASGLAICGTGLVLFSLQGDPIMLVTFAILTSLGAGLSWPAIGGVITEMSVGKGRGGIAGVWTLFMDAAYIFAPMFGGVIAVTSGNVSSVFLVAGVVLLSFPLALAAVPKKPPL